MYEFEQLKQEFINYCHLSISKVTTYNYCYALEKYFCKYCNVSISELKKRHIIQIYSQITNEKGRNTAKNVKNAITKYFNFLNDVYEANLNLSILNIKIPEYVITNTSTIDSKKTLELLELMKKKKGFANQRNILMFLILASTGIRRKEIVGIKLDDIDFENNTIYISNPKGNKKHRTVLLAEIVKNYLKDYLIERNKRADKNVQNLLITQAGKECTIDTIGHVASRLSKRYNINFSLHSFRRGLATELYNDNNIQVQDIALLLGHTKIQTTVDHYIKADKKRLNTALENHTLFKIKEEEPKCVHFNDILKMFQERQIKEN